MNFDKSLLENTKKLMLIRYPRFGAEIAAANLEFRTDLEIHTAATDGKNIFFDPDYFESLTDDERVFIIAHEIMHIKFKHMFRIKDKNGRKRDPEIWNIATDAVINANLQKDGFTIKKGYVDIPEAINYTSEQVYDILLSGKIESENAGQQSGAQGDQGDQSEQGDQGQGSQGEQQGQQSEEQGDQENQNGQGDQGQGSQGEQQGQQNEAQGDQGDQNEQGDQGQGSQGEQQGQQNEAQGDQGDQNGQGGQGQPFSNSQVGAQKEQQASINQAANSSFDIENLDDHGLWEDAYEQMQKKSQNPDKSFKDKNKNLQKNENDDFGFEKDDEKSEFEENRKERETKAKKRLNDLRSEQKTLNFSGERIIFDNVGTAKPVVNWKTLLKREVEKEETVWSQRRSIAENNYAYRLEENEIDDEAETEVMLDVSGSVSIEMIREFLRQLKPILKESKLKVGCFNERFWGMTEIKTDKDIDRFKIPIEARGHSAWTEDWDLAVRSFSKKREVNKIVFTDGEPAPGTMPREDLKGTNVIWLVYGNEEFSPCCGTVIRISSKDLKNLQSLYAKEQEPSM